MKRIEIKELYEKHSELLGKEVTIAGWMRSSRDNKNFAFYDINDGTCMKGVQVVLESENLENYDDIKNVNTGSSVVVTGILVKSPNEAQPFEVSARKVKVINEAPKEYPMQKKRHTLDFLRTEPSLRPRTNLFNAVFRVRSECAYAIHNFFHNNGYMYVHTPIITASDCEGAGELFRLTTHNIYDSEAMKKASPKTDFFEKNVYLTPTGQLEAEAFALSFSKVYTFGPTFRSENSNTARHASEFWMIEPEVAFADLNDIMELGEDLVKYVINHVTKTCPEEIKFFDSFVEKGLVEKLSNVTNNDFAKITYTEAIDILEKNVAEFEFPVAWGDDLKSEHEKFLCEKIYKKPVFVTDYPKEIKSFYMKVNADNKTVRACDMLVPGIGELIGGSQREDNFDALAKRIDECGLNAEDYSWYMNLRKYGSVEHSGFGIGFERLVMYITGVANIRDVLPFPRTSKTCA